MAIQGNDDQYGTQAQVEAIAAQSGGEVELLLLPDCGHTPHREQEATTFAAMQSFIHRLKGDR